MVIFEAFFDNVISIIWLVGFAFISRVMCGQMNYYIFRKNYSKLGHEFGSKFVVMGKSRYILISFLCKEKAIMVKVIVYKILTVITTILLAIGMLIYAMYDSIWLASATFVISILLHIYGTIGVNSRDRAVWNPNGTRKEDTFNIK